jgi:hypothetical protein
MSVHSNHGGGCYGHLTLTVNNAIYTALPNAVAFPDPVAPPADPVIPANATGAQINESFRRHHDLQSSIDIDTDRTLVRLIIASTPETYIKALLDPDKISPFSTENNR